MEKTFTSEGMVKKFKRMKLMSLILFVIGIVMTIAELFAKGSGGTFQSIGTFLDNAFIFISAVYLFFFARNKLKRVSGKLITFNDRGVLLRLNHEDIIFNRENKPKSMAIKLKTINITTRDNQEIIITLDDFSTGTMTRREIKEEFKKLDEKLSLSNSDE